MNVDFVLMGHVSRETFHSQIVDDLGVSEMKSSIDDGSLGVWENAKRAWQMVDKKSDYGVVIQDDAILCDHFALLCTQFLEEHKGHVISFYFGDDPKWIKPNYFDAWLSHAVCLAIPTSQIDDMIKYCDKRTEVFGDDMKMRRWLIKNYRMCRYSNPSLVQHRDIPSIVNPDKPVRQSAIFEG